MNLVKKVRQYTCGKATPQAITWLGYSPEALFWKVLTYITSEDSSNFSQENVPLALRETPACDGFIAVQSK